MKKIVIVFSLILISANYVMASSYPKYDTELSKIRTVKNAQTSVINSQINEISVKIVDLETDTSLSDSKKAEKIREYNAQIDKLTKRKIEISEKYKADKQQLKRLYKHK